MLVLNSPRNTVKHSGTISPINRPLTDSKVLHITGSNAMGTELVNTIAQRQTERWLKENTESIAHNFVEQHVLPLAKYGIFNEPV